jgi:hypothetical protein
MAATGWAGAQEREIGALEKTRPPERPVTLADGPAQPPTPETEAWLAKSVTPGDWRLISKEAAGAVFAKPAGAVRSDGVVAMHLRLEYAAPFTAAKRQFRSVQADLEVNCGSKQLNGSVNGFEDQNLSGKKMYLQPGEVLVGRSGGKPQTENLRAVAFRLINSQIVRQQCAEGHQGLIAKYGAQWRPLLSDERGVRLVSGGDSVGLDRKLDLKFRIEAKDAQATPALRWRSALADVALDCASGSFAAKATLYGGADESGESAKLDFDGLTTPFGVRTSAPGQTPEPAGGGGRSGLGAAAGDTGPGKTLVDLLNRGALVFGECDAAHAKLAQALASPGDPLRRQAESWASETLNTKGFRLPTYVPEGVLMLSDEVISAPGNARRAVVRAEFSRPILTREGKAMASRITVIEVDCAGRKVRGVSESTFAKNGAKDLIRETPAPQAPWSDFEDQSAMVGYFDAVCASKLAS